MLAPHGGEILAVARTVVARPARRPGYGLTAAPTRLLPRHASTRSSISRAIGLRIRASITRGRFRPSGVDICAGSLSLGTNCSRVTRVFAGFAFPDGAKAGGAVAGVRRLCVAARRAPDIPCSLAARGPLGSAISQERCGTDHHLTATFRRKKIVSATARALFGEVSRGSRGGERTPRGSDSRCGMRCVRDGMRCVGDVTRWRRLVITAAIVVGAALVAQAGSSPAAASTLPTGFRDSVVLSGLSNPTVLQFAPDGRIFVGQKNGVIKVFQSLTDTSPVTVRRPVGQGPRLLGSRAARHGAAAELPDQPVRLRAVRVRRPDRRHRADLGRRAARPRPARPPTAVWCRGGCRGCRSAGTS